MPLSDAQMARLEALLAKPALSDAEMGELEQLDSAALGLSDAMEPDSPLAKALASQDGDVVTVETPTGPAQFDRQGNRVMSQDEVSQALDAGGGQLKQRALEGALSFLSGGGPLVDEAQGVKSALKRSMATLAGRDAVDPVTAYRQGRDTARKDVAQATRNASPDVNVMGVDVPVLPVLGAVAGAGPLAEGVVPRLVAASYGAGLQGAGASEADLTKGDVGGVAQDAAISGVLGLGGQAFGEGIGAVSRPLTKALRGQSAAASQAVVDAQQAAANKAAQSAVGSVGGRTAGVANTMDRLMEIARNELGLYSPEQVAGALERLREPDMTALREQMARNLTAKAGNQGPQLEKARAEMIQAFQEAEPQAVAASAAAKLDPATQSRDFGRSLWKSIGQRALIAGATGAAGAGVSALTGGDTAKGGLAGLAGGAFLSQPGVLAFLRNQAGNPARQALINAMAANGAEAAGRGAAAIGRTEGLLAGRGATELTNEERRRVEAFLSALRGGPPGAPVP